MPNPFRSIVASQLVPESTYAARQILASYDYFVTEDGYPLIAEICITPTLTLSSYYIDNA
jgi:hypothetical protein